jgi:ABC-type bacteriocin/lantibiotic exporter with double-glycine peptidase domain
MIKEQGSMSVPTGGAGMGEGALPPPIDASELERTLVHLAAVMGTTVVSDRVRHAALSVARQRAEPLELLCSAADEVGLRIAVASATLVEAVWSADGLSPIVLYSARLSRWLIVRKVGLFRLRVSWVQPGSEPETRNMSRAVLARLLGLAGLHETVEFGVVQSLRFMADVHGTELPDDYHAADTAAPGPITRYLAVLRPEAQEVAAITSFTVVTALLYLALPLAVSAFVTNVAFGNQSAPFIQALLFIGIALAGALVLSALIRGLQLYTGEVVKRRLYVRLVADLTERLPRVDIAALQGVNATELVNRFLDIVTVQRATERILLTGIPVVLGVVIGTVVLGLYHPTLAVFSIALTTGLAVAYLSGRGAIDAAIGESKLKYETVGWLEELARVPILFKGAGGQAFARLRSEEIALRYLVARKRYFSVYLRQVGVLLLLEIVATAALLLVGGWLVLRQQLTLGQLVASELIVASITYSMSRLASLLDAFYGGLAAIDKIGHLTDLRTERTGGDVIPGTAAGMRVECRDVGFSYATGTRVLNGFDLDVAPGECVALWGMSGRGGSTALHVLFGLYAPQEGYVRLDGLDIRGWDLERLRAKVGLLRAGELVSGSIVENLRLGREDIDAGVVTSALERVGLLEDVLAMPQGMGTQMLPGGLPLSSRQRQRLLIARALVHRPALLLVDDLLDGMDPETLQDVIEILAARENGWTVLIATRDPSVARVCDRHVEIDANGGTRFAVPRFAVEARP